jgi:hypothetical protein
LSAPSMDRELLAAALRVLKSSYSGPQASEADLALVRVCALPSEETLEIADVAAAVIWRIVHTVPRPMRVSAKRTNGC